MVRVFGIPSLSSPFLPGATQSDPSEPSPVLPDQGSPFAQEMLEDCRQPSPFYPGSFSAGAPSPGSSDVSTAGEPGWRLPTAPPAPEALASLEDGWESVGSSVAGRGSHPLPPQALEPPRAPPPQTPVEATWTWTPLTASPSPGVSRGLLVPTGGPTGSAWSQPPSLPTLTHHLSPQMASQTTRRGI